MSPEEEIAHEEQVARILAIRQRGRPSHWWEASGVTAMLSAVAGAVIAFGGSYLLKDREMEKESVEARVDRIRKAALDANDALASMLKANEERFLVVTKQMTGLTLEQQTAIVRATNNIQQAWRLKRENAQMGLVLAFDGDSTVDTTWTSARNAMEQLTACIEDEYARHMDLKKRASKNICEAHRSATDSAVKTFLSRLRQEYKNALAQFP
jgi:hypothetical protein